MVPGRGHDGGCQRDQPPCATGEAGGRARTAGTATTIPHRRSHTGGTHPSSRRPASPAWTYPGLPVTNLTAGALVCAEVDWIIKPLWDQVHALLPKHHLHTDPLGCHRPASPTGWCSTGCPAGAVAAAPAVEEVRLERVQLRTRVTLRRQMRMLAREAPGYASPRATTATKQPGHFSTKNAASQSWSSTSSPWSLIPQAMAPVAASTAWVGPTGTVLADLKTQSGRCAMDGICSNCSAPTLYRIRGASLSDPGSILPGCLACPSRLPSARAALLRRRRGPKVRQGSAAPHASIARSAPLGVAAPLPRRPGERAFRRSDSPRPGSSASSLPREPPMTAGDHFQLLPAAGVAAVMAWWGVLQARVVQLGHRAGAAAWRQPSRPPRQHLPVVTVTAAPFLGGAAPHRPLGPP